MARRSLTADEAALWRAVTAEVRALPESSPDRVRSAPLNLKGPGYTTNRHCEEAESRRGNPDPKQRLGLLRSARNDGSAMHRPTNTLDAKWDKQLRLGQVAPDHVIDLHEHSAAAAHARLDHGLAAAISREARLVLLITGKPRAENPRLPPTTRGVIRASVLDWLALSPHRTSVAAIRTAHPKHGGAGALYLVMRRARGE